MKRKIIAGLLVLASLASITGCGSNEPNSDNNNRNESNNSEQNGSGTMFVSYEYDAREMSASNVANSVLVTDMIAEANAGANVMYSPTSLNMALGLVGEGASGNSGKLISSFLGTDSYGERAEQLLASFDDKYNYGDSKKGNCCKLELANALWVDKSISLLKDYEKIAGKQYQANAAEVNFGSPEKACKLINKWADDNTHGLIKEIIDESLITPDTRLCITNSLYFEAPWKDEWYVDKKETEFTMLDGSKKEIEYIANEGGSYFVNDMATAFSCRYANGLEFIGILPNDEGEFTLEELDIESLLASRRNDHDELYYRMPRLTFDTSANLNDAFKALGMEDLFTNGVANIDGIASESLYISSIVQKTRIELDEYGTKAAAVTAVAMDCEGVAMYVEDPVVRTVYLDRPFAFLIYDSADDEILFMGKVVDPIGE